MFAEIVENQQQSSVAQKVNEEKLIKFILDRGYGEVLFQNGVAQ